MIALIWPVYLYEESQGKEYRKQLSKIRKGNLEGLAKRIESSDWFPDYGPSYIHKTLGASVTGAREILIAYNISLDSKNLKLAKDIAKSIRASDSLRAIGWEMEHYNCVQISTNITNYKKISPGKLFEKVKNLAAEKKVMIKNSELIGLIPLEALTLSAKDLSLHTCNIAVIAKAIGLESQDIREIILENLVVNKNT